MTAPDKEWSLAGAALMIHRIPSLGPLAVRHRLNERGDRRASNSDKWGATLKPPDLAPRHQFAPARSNALAHKALLADPDEDHFERGTGRIVRNTSRKSSKATPMSTTGVSSPH